MVGTVTRRQRDRFNVGPVSFRTHAADVRYLKWAETELLRRIFVTARNREWEEVPPSNWSCSASQDRESLVLRLAATHTGSGVDVAWRGLFSVDIPERSFSFSFTGTALRDMEVCRLGVVVLHPMQTLIGGTVETSGPTGRRLLHVMEQIHPQPIVNGSPAAITEPFEMLVTESRVGDSLRFKFSGDLFEMEDQRNWCDASFKSYCTPLSLGFPRRLSTGDDITQRVDVIATLGKDHSDKPAADDFVSFQPDASGRRLPRLGMCVDLDAAANSHWRRSQVFTHLRVDLPTTASIDDLETAERLLTTGQMLELGLALEAEEVPADLLAAIGGSDALGRILLLQNGQGLIHSMAGKRVVNALGRRGCRTPILTAIDDQFVELNRSIPLSIAGSGLALLACPTIHSADVLTATENVPALRYVIQTARFLYPGLEVVVSPLTLSIASVPVESERDDAALAWFVASYETLAASEVTSVTIASDLLPFGKGQAPQVAAWSYVLEALARAQDGIPLTTSVTAGSSVHIVGWEEASTGDVEFLAGNLADDPRQLQVTAPSSEPLTARIIWDPMGDGIAPVRARALSVPGYGVLHGRFSQNGRSPCDYDIQSDKEHDV